MARLKKVAVNGENNISQENYTTQNIKFQIPLWYWGNASIKTELNNKQHIIEKLLNMISNKSKGNDMKISDNTLVNKNGYMFENNSKSKANPSKDANDQNENGKPILDSNKRVLPKKKVTIIMDSCTPKINNRRYVKTILNPLWEIKVIRAPFWNDWFNGWCQDNEWSKKAC